MLPKFMFLLNRCKLPPGALLGILLLNRDFLMRKWWGFGGNLCVVLTVDLFLITTEFLSESRCFSTGPPVSFAGTF